MNDTAKNLNGTLFMTQPLMKLTGAGRIIFVKDIQGNASEI